MTAPSCAATLALAAAAGALAGAATSLLMQWWLRRRLDALAAAAAPAPPRRGAAAAGSRSDDAAEHRYQLLASAQVSALRLRPGDDLLAGIEAFVARNGLRACSIVQTTGSLVECAIRFANAPTATILRGHFEIVSLTGTLAAPRGTEPASHVHIALADGTGAVVGGHLLRGSSVFTTAEVTLVEAPGLVFTRPVDAATTWDELAVELRE